MRWLVLAAILLPFVDLWMLFAFGGRFGALHAVGYALLGAFAGLMLTRAEGLRVLLKLREALNGGEPPTDGVLSGILVVVGGLLIALPGPISDVLGVALFVPPLRRALAASMRDRIERRIAATTMHMRGMRVDGVPLGGVVDVGGFARAAQDAARPRAQRGRAPRGVIIETEGEVVDTEGEVVDTTGEERPRLPGSR